MISKRASNMNKRFWNEAKGKDRRDFYLVLKNKNLFRTENHLGDDCPASLWAEKNKVLGSEMPSSGDRRCQYSQTQASEI